VITKLREVLDDQKFREFLEFVRQVLLLQVYDLDQVDEYFSRPLDELLKSAVQWPLKRWLKMRRGCSPGTGGSTRAGAEILSAGSRRVR